MLWGKKPEEQFKTIAIIYNCDRVCTDISMIYPIILGFMHHRIYGIQFLIHEDVDE